MRIEERTYVRDYPPKLKEFAIKRMLEQHSARADKVEEWLDYPVSSLFKFKDTPEHDFWQDVSNNREIQNTWGELEIYQIY